MPSFHYPTWLKAASWIIEGNLPMVTRHTLIGILVAITGNVLISLALNLQKLAHKRVEEDNLRIHAGDGVGRSEMANGISGTAIREESGVGSEYYREDVFRSPSTTVAEELRPLTTPTNGRAYGSFDSEDTIPDGLPPKKHTFFTRLARKFRRTRGVAKPRSDEETSLLFVDDELPEGNDLPIALVHSQPSEEKPKEMHYLKSKLWWLGFLLMNVGETGNFISYAYAPASIVAPLGTFALMANCIFAPFLLKERFRKRDLFGIAIAIIGAVTVVLSSNASETRLNPEGLLHAISQPLFIAFSIVYAIGAVVLASLSEKDVGKHHVFVDVGLCAIFGGFTVLSTKAISTLLTMEWIEMFTQWITYPTLAVLISTGIGQVHYLNRALMKFDSKVVIPIQFVLFTLSAIIGSAILYGDFQKAEFHQIVTFLYGCAATFAGVFIIASSSQPSVVEDDGEGEDAQADQRTVDDDTSRAPSTIGRRRATAMPPSSPAPAKHRQSSISLLGLSPAQHLLLVHTPPSTGLDARYRELESERDVGQEPPVPQSPDSVAHRLRTYSWLGEETSSLGRANSQGRGSSRRRPRAPLAHVTPEGGHIRTGGGGGGDATRAPVANVFQ
ncbi:DUF803-domain-containing protein [Pluteus cervinus]|uniref:DUF803-domain-containing protein n=1 Tax=Pluteus cervinus TaxID=181527 RepID=A0ACD3BEP5_9AGAR|nr:DUF803-domain-containing protein [Pluteus cervinus]